MISTELLRQVKPSVNENSLLVTTIVSERNLDRMVELSDYYTDYSDSVKVLFLSTYLDYTIDDYIKFSEHRFKVYNKFVDYKPFLVRSFVYLCNYLTPVSEEEKFWRTYLFSFVFAFEYDYANVLYVPFHYDITKEEFEKFVANRNQFRTFQKPCSSLLSAQSDYINTQNSLLFVSYKDFNKFFDSCFKVSDFFFQKDLFQKIAQFKE